MKKTSKAAKAAPENPRMHELLRLAKKYHNDRSKFLELGAVVARLRDEQGISVRQAAKLLNTTYRRLYFMLDCHEAVQSRRVTKTVALELGWTKLSLIAPYLTKSSAENAALVEIAKTSKANDLARHMSSRMRQEPHEPRSLMTLNPTDRQRQMLEAALLNAGAHRNKRGGLAAKEDALMVMLERAKAA